MERRRERLDRFNRFTAGLATTEGALLAIGVIMLFITITTVSNDRLDSLPLQSALFPLGIIQAVLGLYGWFHPEPAIRRWTGGCLFLYAQVRSIAWAYQIADRTVGIWGWIQESTTVWIWQLPAVLGFLVWARARHEPYREDR